MGGSVRRWVASATVAAVIVGLVTSVAVGSASAAPPDKHSSSKADHGPAVNNDVSAPLRDMRPASHVARREHPDSPMPAPTGPAIADPVVQQTVAPVAAPSSTTFPGVGANGSAPSDSNGAVGPAYYIDLVNTELAIYPKTGSSLGAAVVGPETTNTLWNGFGGECQSENDGDGTVRYDALADRWLVSQFALGPSGNGPFLQCLAVSTTADPTGSYYRYAFAFSSFPDYPKTAVWPDGYYQTMNTFNTSGSFLGAETCAYDRAKMLNGQPATMQCFVMNPSLYGAFLPGDLDGVTVPPAGEPNTQIGLGADNTHLASLRFHVDWSNPNNTTLSETDVPVAAYVGACNGGGTCIPQLGTSQQLDSLADRVMYRFAYRNLGTEATPNEHWVATYSVNVNGVAAPRWWEFGTNAPGSGALTVLQDSTYAPPDTNHRWMGSIAQDQAGNIGLGYSESSSAIHPALAFTGHQVASSPPDPLNAMESESIMYSGGGSQTTGLSRWGDYSSMTPDPSNGCTFWYTNQYIPSNGTFNWQTRIGSFAFPSCAPRTDSDFSMALFPAFGTVAAPATGSATTTSTLSTATTAGSSQTIALAASTPAGSGIGASFSSASASPGNPSTLTLTIPAGTAPNTYPVTVTGTGPPTASPHTVTYWLTVAAPGINNGGFENGDLSFWTVAAGSASATTCAPHSGAYAAWLGGTSANCGVSPTSGDSSISQTFTLAQASTLSFWYDTSCPDTLTYDWVTATLTDNTANTTTVLVPKTCTTSAGWIQVTNTLGASTVGHSLTLTLTSHDDNYPFDPTVTKFDDVTLTPTSTGDFTIQAAPSSQTVTAGSSTTYTTTVTPTGGFNGSVAFSVSGLPSGASGSFSPTSVNTSPWTSTLTVTTNAATPAGTYPLTITGTSGALTHSTPVSLVVNPGPDFSLSASPSTQTVTAGATTSPYTITVSPSNGFTGTVTFTASGLPPGATATFTPASVSASPWNSALTIATAASTPGGAYTVTVTATSGALTHSTTATVVVSSFSASVSPSSRSVRRGKSTTYTVTITALGGFTGTVSLSVTGLPGATSASFNPTSVNSAGTSTLTITTTNSTPTGTRTLTITATSGSISKTTTATLTVTRH